MFFRKFTIYSSVMLSVFTMSIVGSFAAQAATFTVTSFDSDATQGSCTYASDNASAPNRGSLRYVILNEACAPENAPTGTTTNTINFEAVCGTKKKEICLTAPIVIPADCAAKIRIENDSGCDANLAIRAHESNQFSASDPLIRIERAGTIINGMNFIKAKGDALQIAADDVQVRHSNFGVREESNTATAYPNAGAGVRLVSKSSGAGPENAYIATSTFRANKGGAIVIESGKNHTLYFNNFFGNGGQDINLVKAGESAGAVTPAEGVTGAATDPNELVKYPYDVVAKMEACTQGSNDLACVRLTGTFDGVLSGETANLLIQHTPKTSSDVSAGFYHAMVSINSANFDVLIPAAPQALTLDSAPTIVTGDTLRVVGMAASGNTSELSATVIIDDPNACKKKDFYVDNDGDSYGNTKTLKQECSAPDDGLTYVEVDGDCNDDDPEIHPGATEIPYDRIDQDCDTFDLIDVDGDGEAWVGNPVGTYPNGADCNDLDPAINNAAGNCALAVPDADGDGSPADLDCDDANNTVYPGALELCDGLDNDCNGAIDDNPACHDADGDTHTTIVSGGDDCNDTNSTVYPGAPEVCDGLDNDCDTFTDEGVCAGPANDVDQDGFTTDNPLDTAFDCNDRNNTVHPGATEICNTIDDDCDGRIDEDNVCLVDNDNDGSLDDVDCDDNNSAVHPGATEICNLIDDNCDGQIDEGNVCLGDNDVDDDGHDTIPSGGDDCNDRNEAVNPDEAENCTNGIDDDCNGKIDGQDDACKDEDNDDDGQTPAGGDCNDANATIFTGAVDIPDDGIDQDCNGIDATENDPITGGGTGRFNGGAGCSLVME